jgi:hypothetical protein
MKTPLQFFAGLTLACSISLLDLSSANAQTKNPEKPQISEKEIEALQGDVPFAMVEQMPTYAGGKEELLNYLREAVPSARNQKGLSIFTFIVNRDGSISNVEVIKSLHAATDKKIADALMATSGKWTPGQQYDYKVRISYTLPINYPIDNSQQTEVITTPVVNYDDDRPYTSVEIMPSFIDGGRQGFLKRLDQAIPNQQDIQGISAFTFIVERDGTLSEIQPVSSVHLENEELLKAALQETSGKWSPGSQNNKLVRVRMTVSIKYPILADHSSPARTKKTKKRK